jgi:hypothetical protein
VPAQPFSRFFHHIQPSPSWGTRPSRTVSVFEPIYG